MLICMAKDADPVVSNGDRLQTVKRRQEDRILSSLALIAQLLEHDESYMPIFLRLEAELEKAKAQQSAFQRAKTFARARR